jgi:hypothetical protein
MFTGEIVRRTEINLQKEEPPDAEWLNLATLCNTYFFISSFFISSFFISSFFLPIGSSFASR